MKIDRLSIFKYTLPLILSGLAEQLLLLTDVFFISFKGDKYLATIGLIDSFLLCCLSYGFALNDTFQNFYSRNSGKTRLIKNVHKKSLTIFVKHAMIITIVFSCIAYLVSNLFNNNIYQLFLGNIPVIVPLIILSYVSLSMNAFLLGLGKTKAIGHVSLSCMFINAFLGYILLFQIKLQTSPLTVILYTSIIAEIIGIILMQNAIRKSTPKTQSTEIVKLNLLIYIRNLSYYPALSDLSFHIGSFILFLFCSTILKVNETAILTIILTYWGVLLVPAEAFAETALNHFSLMYSKNKTANFQKLRKNIIETSLIVSGIILLGLLLLDYMLYGIDEHKLIALTIVSTIVFIATFNEIFSITLIVRLKNNLFAASRVLYGSIAIILILTLTFIWKNEAISIFLSLLGAQIVSYLFLKHKSNEIWLNKNRF